MPRSYYQKSFEQALQDAEGLLEDSALQKWTHRRLPRLGGSSKKPMLFRRLYWTRFGNAQA